MLITLRNRMTASSQRHLDLLPVIARLRQRWKLDCYEARLNEDPFSMYILGFGLTGAYVKDLIYTTDLLQIERKCFKENGLRQ